MYDKTQISSISLNLLLRK